MSLSKKSSRRKTLSHLEIDEFLRESDNVMLDKETSDNVFKKTKVEEEASRGDLAQPVMPKVNADFPPVMDPDDEHLVRQFKGLVGMSHGFCVK